MKGYLFFMLTHDLASSSWKHTKHSNYVMTCIIKVKVLTFRRDVTDQRLLAVCTSVDDLVTAL